jgi:NAD(P)-dependent dehydrogenase (short-subunit alcohol dehydrogenase family)
MSIKTVLITGATKGIGLATSLLLSRNGYNVIGIARHPDKDFPGTLFLCDLSHEKQTAEIIQAIASSCFVDAIVNNVGISSPEPLGKIDLNALRTVYELNVRSAVQITQAFIESMQKKKWGRIVNISSRAIFGIKDRTSYSAAKSALIGCTRTWALELALSGITVNAVAPGPIETELFRKTRPVGSLEEKKVLESIPLGRLGRPQEIAATIAFLLSEDAAFITGQTICVDGGGSL